MSNKTLIISIDGMAAKYLKNSKIQLKNMKNLMKKGVFCDQLTTVFPTSTWTIHTSVVTGTYPGKHGVLGNWVFDRQKNEKGEFFGDREYDKDKVVSVPALYDVAKEYGYTTASLCWPVTRGASKIDWNIPEFYEQELFDEFATQTFWEELKRSGYPVHKYGEWSTDHGQGHLQDHLTAKIAEYLFINKQPDITFLHFLLVDSYHHDYGNDSPQVYWAIEYIDSLLGELMNTLENENLSNQTDVYLFSDHGLTDMKREFYPNRLFAEKGWINRNQKERSSVIAVSNGGSLLIYLNDKENVTVESVSDVLRNESAVDLLFTRDDFPSSGFPGEGEWPLVCPDMIVGLKHDTYAVEDDKEGPVYMEVQSAKGKHGHFPNSEDLTPFFIAAGPSIGSGKIENMHIVDIAPTIAFNYQLPFSHSDGRILKQIFKGGEALD
ncbi:alkaline phosphatase family protein [Evansella tamaricis]|uniref:Alkaline phosphatase family protein n=1 Tax=Evansella tamaricis TaxID=2069301 RepID=A0ABS6JAG0_9BACI|nr:nucleotide pyrophosphatase/phosphodiesterase family protein [Evansella tamaricis]MBU9710674.1 alkaline phosphatase family protein [Evansella tamaricis]